MAISMNTMNNTMNTMNNDFAVVRSLRQSIINKIYERTIVITKVEIKQDRKTKEWTEEQYYGQTNDSLFVRAFNLSKWTGELEVRVKKNVQLKNSDEETRVLKVDGQKVLLSEEIVQIICEDQNKMEELMANGWKNSKGELFIATESSPSTEKHCAIYFTKVNYAEIERTGKTADRLAFEKIDAIMGNVFSNRFEEINNMNKKAGQAFSKLNTRWGNSAAPMQTLYTIDLTKDCIAIINGETAYAHDFDEQTIKDMKNLGLEIGNNVNDGLALKNVEVAKEIGKQFGLNLTDEQALRVAYQDREDVVTSKVMSIHLLEDTLRMMADANKATYYGNKNGRLMALYDTDGAKLINRKALENKRSINVNVMQVAWASEKINLSNQLLIKYVTKGEDAINKVKEFVKTTTTAKLNDFMKGQLEGEATGGAIDERIIRTLGLEAIQDALLVESMANSAMTFGIPAFANNRLSVEGIHSHMMFDLTYQLTNGLINNILGKTKEGFVEAFSADICRRYNNFIKEVEADKTLSPEERRIKLQNKLSGDVIKYPSAMPKEVETVVYMTMEQVYVKINTAVAALNVDNKVKKAIRERLIHFFNHAPYGVTVYAPINAMKNKLAGADCDFDATDVNMSDLKFITMEERITERKTNKGYMGDCTFISYSNLNRPADIIIEKQATEETKTTSIKQQAAKAVSELANL